MSGIEFRIELVADRMTLETILAAAVVVAKALIGDRLHTHTLQLVAMPVLLLRIAAVVVVVAAAGILVQLEVAVEVGRTCPVAAVQNRTAAASAEAAWDSAQMRYLEDTMLVDTEAAELQGTMYLDWSLEPELLQANPQSLRQLEAPMQNH